MSYVWLINYENYLSLLFADTTSVSACARGWLQTSLRTFFMWKDLPHRQEQVKKRERKGQSESFSHYRSKGKAVSGIKLMWMSPVKFSCTYLFLGKLRSQRSFMNYLCHSKSVCACFCINDVFLCLSLVVHHSGLVIVAISKKNLFSQLLPQHLWYQIVIGWVSICACSYLNINILFSMQR